MKRLVLFLLLSIYAVNVYSQISPNINVCMFNVKNNKSAFSIDFLPYQLSYGRKYVNIPKQHLTLYNDLGVPMNLNFIDDTRSVMPVNDFYIVSLHLNSYFKTVKQGNVYGYDLLDCYSYTLFGVDLVHLSWYNKSFWLSQSITIGTFCETWKRWTQDTSGNTIGWGNSTYSHANHFRSQERYYGVSIGYRIGILSIGVDLSKNQKALYGNVVLPICTLISRL